MRRAFVSLLLVAGCPEGDDGDDGPAAGSTGAATETGTTGPLCAECNGDPSCHSEVGISGHCYCAEGHTWANDDPNDYTCAPVPPRTDDGTCAMSPNVMLVDGQCYCEPGFNWCSDDPADLTCCMDAAQGGESTS